MEVLLLSHYSDVVGALYLTLRIETQTENQRIHQNTKQTSNFCVYPSLNAFYLFLLLTWLNIYATMLVRTSTTNNYLPIVHTNTYSKQQTEQNQRCKLNLETFKRKEDKNQ